MLDPLRMNQTEHFVFDAFGLDVQDQQAMVIRPQECLEFARRRETARG